MSGAPTYWLSTHVGYGCRHSGDCCTSRWPIPVERVRLAAVQRAIDEQHVTTPERWYDVVPDQPPDIAGVLAHRVDGSCVFHRRRSGEAAGGCAIHAVRPAACAHFPQACRLDPRGVHVTLSHYCPTAAAMLFEAAAPVEIVPGPPVFEDGRWPEGLDATDALPPCAEDGRRLLSWDEVSAWEAARVAALSTDETVPASPDVRALDHARHAVPAPWSWPAGPADLDRAWATLVAPHWMEWTSVIGRYLAAKVHASWALFVGEGLRAVDRHVDLARAVLQVEAVRQCQASGTPLDRGSLTRAIRQSDLLLMHLADPDGLHVAVQWPVS